MPLNDITFQVASGGLGRKTPNEDNVTAMMFAIAAPSSPTWPTNKFKSFTNIEEVKTAGITKGNATYGEVYYQAEQFFRLAPGATLWIGLASTIPTYAEMHTATGGKVRQVGAYFTTFSDITSVHQAGIDALAALHAPLVAVVAYQGPSLATSTLADQAVNTAPQVAVLLAGDGAGDGAALATTLTKVYIPALGAVLGAAAKASVHENIGWVEKFNLSDGKELDTIRLCDGSNNPTSSVLDGINTKRYLVFRKHTGINGTYLNDSHTATAATSDFAYLEPNRTLQKARRLVRAALLPDLNSPITVDASTGKIAPASIKYFESKCAKVLNFMQADGEVSGFGVYVDPDQNVLSTSTLNIVVRIVPRGVARNIVVNIGLTVSTQL